MGSTKTPRPFVTKERVPRYLEDLTVGPAVSRNITALLDGLRECRDAITEIERGFRIELFEKLQAAYEISDAFKENVEAYDIFCKDPVWNKCKLKRPTRLDDQDQKISWVVRYIFGVVSTESPRYNRAYKYWRTLQGFARDNIPAEKVSEMLLQEGVEYAFLTEARKHPRKSALVVDDDEVDSGAGATLDSGAGATIDMTAKSGGEPRIAAAINRIIPDRKGYSQASGAKSESPKEADEIDEVRQLCIEVREEEMAIAMDLDVGELCTVKFEHVETLPSGWKRFVATRVRINFD